jgi:hypothetical protein
MDPKDFPELEGIPVIEDLLERKVPKVKEVMKDVPEILEKKVLLVDKEILDPWDLLELPVLKDLEGFMDQREKEALEDVEVVEDVPALLGLLD